MTVQRPRILAANHAPAFGWAFMAVWMTILTGMTYVFLRDNGIPDMPYALAFAVLVLFWLFGVLASTFFFAIPRTSVRAAGPDLLVCEHWLLGRRLERLRSLDARDLFVAQEEDSDGAAYFACMLVTPSGRHVKLFESHSRQLAEQAHARLLAAARDAMTVGGDGGPRVLPPSAPSAPPASSATAAPSASSPTAADANR